MYLVDTNVLSVEAPDRRNRSTELFEWMSAHSELLFISTVTVAEIKDGITKLQRTGATTRAERLSNWLRLVLHLYANRVVPFDTPAALIAGTFMDFGREKGFSPGFPDIAIAATAKSRELIVLTANLRHFLPFDVAAVDPFEKLPNWG